MLALLALAVLADGATLTMIHTFTNVGIDGGLPDSELVQGTDGNFYGVAPIGGTNGSRHGIVFKVTPEGAFTTLHQFSIAIDGGQPSAGLVRGSDSNFYGTTLLGGTSSSGTTFKITPAGTLTTLHHFSGTDGSGPNAKLLQASDGNFYGTTSGGGSNNWGTVFKMTPSGTLTTLYQFSGGADGGSPKGKLAQSSNGYFYGTTDSGGISNNNCVSGCGTVFAMTPTGTLTVQRSDRKSVV